MSNSDYQNESDIAVIGMSARFPGARNVDEFWSNIRNGVESIVPLSDDELRAAGVPEEEFRQPNYVKAASYIDDVEMFDAGFFGFNAREASIVDPQHRIFLECAYWALEHAGYDPWNYAGLIGCYAGCSTNAYLLGHLWTGDKLKNEKVDVSGIHKDYVSSNVSFRLNLRGPSMTIQSFCSTSLVATHVACQSLLNRECDIALAGGVRIGLPQRSGYVYEEGGIMSPDGHVRTFDADAKGIVFGSGAGVVVLKRLREALEDGDTIYAVVRGSSCNNDGATKANYMAPSVDGQSEVVLETLSAAGVHAEDVGYIETHGTGTSLGDPIEVVSLIKAFRTQTEKNGFVALGSVKPNVGHLDAAAGVASFIKTVQALWHKELPPLVNYRRPNPAIDFDKSPFYANATLKPWPSPADPQKARVAGVTALGFGGTNAHVIVQEAPAPVAVSASRPEELLVLSAKTPAALDAMTERLAGHLALHPELALSDVAHTLQIGRNAFPYRRAVSCTSLADASRALSALDPTRTPPPARVENADRKVAFLFPGQGAQYAGMGRELYESEPLFAAELRTCDELLRANGLLDESILEVLYSGGPSAKDAEEKLMLAAYAQPISFAFEYALAKLWMAWGFSPAGMIGHSLGEYVAACLAGVFSLPDALKLVATRGRLMDELLREGAMLAVHLGEKELAPLLPAAVSLASVNAPSLCVVSGPAADVRAFAAHLSEQRSEKRIECRILKLRVAGHSALMEPLLDRLRDVVSKVALHAPDLPYVSNLTGTWITAEQATSAEYWVRHAREMVRFSEGLEALVGDESMILLEVGPGRTLTTFAKQNPALAKKQATVTSVRHPQETTSDRTALLDAVAKIWLAGGHVDWAAFRGTERRRRVPLPGYPFQRQRYWIDPPKESAGADDIESAGTADGKIRKIADVSKWFYAPSWTRRLAVGVNARVNAPAAKDERWLILAHRDALASKLDAALRAHGISDAIWVYPGREVRKEDARTYTMHPARAEHYEQLLAQVTADGDGKAPTRIVHMCSLEWSSAAVEGAQAVGYYSLLHLARALGATSGASPASMRRILVVGNGVYDVTGSEVLFPNKATVSALAKVVQQELTGIACRQIDVPWPSEQQVRWADDLARELVSESDDPVVALRHGHRWLQRYEPIRLGEDHEARAPLREGGVYLITGGLGEVGLTLTEMLTRRVGARVALLSRTGLPPRSEWERWRDAPEGSPELDALEANFAAAQRSPLERRERLGERVRRTIRRLLAIEARAGDAGEVAVFAADVADPESLASAVQQVRTRFGALHGVVHAAGVVESDLDATLLSRLGRDESERQFRAKIYGVYALERVLGDAPLDFCVLMSSNASVLGGLGAGAYGAANAFMDAYAAARHHREGPGRWISLNWDGWPNEKSGAVRTALDEFQMTREEAESAFLRALAAPSSGQIVISVGSLPARLRLWTHKRDESNKDADASQMHVRPELDSTYVAPRNAIEEKLEAIWRSAFRLERIGVFDNFFDLGGHSLMATRILSLVKDAFAVNLRLTSLIMNPTLAQLADVVMAAQDEGGREEGTREEGEI